MSPIQRVIYLLIGLLLGGSAGNALGEGAMGNAFCALLIVLAFLCIGAALASDNPRT